MAAVFRTLVYLTLLIGLILILLPARAVEWSGLTRPSATGINQIAGGLITLTIHHVDW